MKDILKGIVYIGLFAIPFIPLIVSDQMFFPFITGKNFTFRIIVEVIFVSWGLLALLDKAYRPRFSWIAVAGLAFLVIMGIADALGEYPLKSFWSNFERMDGYVTLVHFYLLLLVIGSTLRTKKMWSYFIHTSLAVALYVGMYGLAQQAGFIEGGRNRLDSTLGNAAYMAVYMLFHIFFVLWMMVRSKDWFHRGLYLILLGVFIYVLLLTGTRGTFIGFMGGGLIAAIYLAIFSRSYPQVRKVALGGMALIIVFVALLVAFKDNPGVTDNNALRRISNISLEKDLTLRATIWSLALEGVKERPLLGWGQGNFNYVFNKNFDPSLYNAEAWYDRVHNIILDWLIAGGVLGLISYLSIFVAAVYYLLWRPIFYRESEEELSVGERAVFLGLLAGYFAHNLVVFDNIVSYMFFAITLGYLHYSYGREIQAVVNYKIDPKLVTNIAAPVAVVGIGLLIYFVQLPGIQAAHDIIDAYIAREPDVRLSLFKKGVSRNSFGYQELVEQVAQQGMSIVGNKKVPKEERDRFAAYGEELLTDLIKRKPGDARLHVFFSSFYRAMGNMEKAREQAAIARSLTPNKQSVIIEQGVIEYQMGNNQKALDFFKEAYELDTSYKNARFLYAAMLLNTGEVEAAEELITDEYINDFALDDFGFRAAYDAGEPARDFLIRLMKARVDKQPNNAQNRASLAFLYYERGDNEQAIAVLREAGEAIPTFKVTAECYITNIEAGNEPGAGCQ